MQLKLFAQRYGLVKFGNLPCMGVTTGFPHRSINSAKRRRGVGGIDKYLFVHLVLSRKVIRCIMTVLQPKRENNSLALCPSMSQERPPQVTRTGSISRAWGLSKHRPDNGTRPPYGECPQGQFLSLHLCFCLRLFVFQPAAATV